jgi:AmiR/NasT family two-component response regulator
MALTALIASRDPRTRSALRAAVAGAGAEVVAEACGRWQAGEALRSLEPDVAVVDARLLSTDEFFLTGWGPVARCTRFVAVGDEHPHTVAHLQAMGVAACVVTERLDQELATAIGAHGSFG